MTVRIPIAMLAVVLVCACETRTYKGGVQVVNEEPAPDDRFDKTFHLTRIEIDHQAVRAGAELLFDEPPPHREFGLERRAQGVLSVSDRRFVRAVVKVAEPVVTIHGRRSEQTYTLLSFFGKLSADERTATIMDGEPVDLPSVDRPDELVFLERGDDRIVVQPVHRGRRLAYRYYFFRRGLTNPNVPFPWK